jgi:hypothetical protein
MESDRATKETELRKGQIRRLTLRNHSQAHRHPNTQRQPNTRGRSEQAEYWEGNQQR